MFYSALDLQFEPVDLTQSLSARNVDVDNLNHKELEKLPDAEVLIVANESIVTFEQSIHGNEDSALFQQERHEKQRFMLKYHMFWKHCRAAREIKLKIGAQVETFFLHHI